MEKLELIIEVKKVEKFDSVVLDLKDNTEKKLKFSKFGNIMNQDFNVGCHYKAKVNLSGNVYWLDSVEEIEKKPTPKMPAPEQPPKKASSQELNTKGKLDSLMNSTNTMEVRQLMIMAQSCQHDATQLVSTGIDMKNYESVQELAGEVCELRDALLKDLVEKYYK